MKEKLIVYPEVELLFHTWYHGNPCYDVVPEVKKEKYGYILREGQILSEVRYMGTNHGFRFDVEVLEIRDTGILVWDYREQAFMPFVADYPNGGITKPRKMYIEPCDRLFEKNKMADILSGNIRKENCKIINGRKLPDRAGYGIWYKHGGWRSDFSIYEENLKNFVKLGQIELSDIYKTK